MTKSRSQYIRHWERHMLMIKSSVYVDEQEGAEARALRMAGLEADAESWFRYYFPRYAYAPPARFHLEASARILEHEEWFEVRMWSRELAKSTRTMMEVMYLTLVGHAVSDKGCGAAIRRKKRYVLLVSNSEENAVRLLLPYKANLEHNKRIIQDYGLQEQAGHWQAGEFTTEEGCSYRALGAGQSPRGTRNEEIRPDIILFDDVDTDAECLNPDIISKKWRWIEEAAIGTRSISVPTLILFCGNRIAKDCCMTKAVRHADFVDEVNIRDAEGRSTWPEKNSEADIDRVLKQKSYAAQQKEYFNNPLSEGAVFKAMAYKAARPITDYEMLVCYTDPSYKETSDYKATVLVGRWLEEYHVIKAYVAQTTTAALIDWHYQVMDLLEGQSCYFFIEEVFMQDVILKEISDAGKRTGRSIPIRGDTRKKPDKFVRIESLLEPLLRNGQFYLNEAERHNPNMELLAEQFLNFAPGSRAHDDGPDAVEGAIWKLTEKKRLGIGGGVVQVPRRENSYRY